MGVDLRFPALAICLAALAAVILVAYADGPGDSLATSPPSAQRFSIDMDPANSPANTATSLGSNEICAAMSENNFLDADEDFVDTVEFDVTITGIPAANPMIGYAYSLHYPAPQTSIVGHNWNFLLLSKPGSSMVWIGPDLPDTDGTYNVTGVDSGPNPASAESGTGVLDRLRIEILSSAPGLYPLTLSGAAHVDTGGIPRSPDATDNALIRLNSGTCEADSDSDGVNDLDEFNCGVSTLGASFVPERLNGLDDDGDAAIDEALPFGSGTYDCDGDGYVGTTEAHVFGSGQDQARCGLGSWPADIVTGGVPDSTDRINILDFVTFLAPVRHLNTNVGDNPGNVRWDIVPGKGVFLTDINVADLTSLIILKPAMFSGTRAFNWLACTP